MVDRACLLGLPVGVVRRQLVDRGLEVERNLVLRDDRDLRWGARVPWAHDRGKGAAHEDLDLGEDVEEALRRGEVAVRVGHDLVDLAQRGVEVELRTSLHVDLAERALPADVEAHELGLNDAVHELAAQTATDDLGVDEAAGERAAVDQRRGKPF